MSEKRPLTITHETKTTIGIVASIVITGIASTWAIATKLSAIEGRLGMLESGKYTTASASEQALRMAIENPGMRVPDPRDPSRLIVVDLGRFPGAGARP